MSSPIPGAAESNLDDPAFGAPFTGVEQPGPLVKIEESLLNHLFRFTLVIQYPERDSEHQPRITTVEQVDACCVFGLQPGHQLFVTRRTDLCWLWPGDATFRRSPQQN